MTGRRGTRRGLRSEQAVYSTIVDPQTVLAHLADPTWVVIDCRNDLFHPESGAQAYERAHLPGAFHASLEEDLSGVKTGRNGRHPMPDPAAFARFLNEIGVGEQTQIVAYDAGGDAYAARLWFLAHWIGHAAAAVLDGGFSGWTAAGYATTSEPPARQPASEARTVRLRHESTIGVEDVLAGLGSARHLVLDARSPDRFAGQNETLDPVAGHIPGAVNRFSKENYDERGRMKSPERLRAEFAAAGVTTPEQVVHQCGSGVSACVNLLAMSYAGMVGSRLYPGSWSEWIADPSRPVAGG